MSGMFLLWTKEIIPIGESALTYIRSPEKESTNWAMNICRWLWPRLCCFLHLGPSGFNTDYYILLCYLSRLAKSSALQSSSGCIVKWANCDRIIIEASLICWVTTCKSHVMDQMYRVSWPAEFNHWGTDYHHTFSLKIPHEGTDAKRLRTVVGQSLH